MPVSDDPGIFFHMEGSQRRKKMDILTSRENPTVKNLCKLGKQKARREQGLL